MKRPEQVALKYSQLNLTINQYGARTGREITRDSRHVSQFWTEKAAVLLTFFQYSAFLWLVSTQWPWPFQWLRWTRWTLVALLDVPTFFHHMEMSLSLLWWSVGLLGVALAAILGWLLLRRWYGRLAADLRVGEDHHLCVSELGFRRGFLFAAQFAYLPLLLVFSRTLICDGGKLVELDSSISCWGVGHLSILVFSAIAVVPFALVLPYMLLKQSRKVAVFNSPQLHEKYLRSHEIEYLMGINDVYQEDGFFYVSSFKRRWVHWPFLQCIQKILMVAIYVVFGKWNLNLLQLQAYLICACLVIPAASHVFINRYRCHSTEIQETLLEWTVFASALIGVFSSGDTRSALLVGRTLALILAIINLGGLASWTVSFVRCLFGSEEWPVTLKDVVRVIDENADMIKVINASKRILADAVDTPAEFVSSKDLKELIERLDGLRRQARDRHHLLEWTLQDILEELSLLYENTHDRSLLPNAPLETVLEGLHTSLQARRHNTLLVHPQKAAVLQRLLVVRGLLGDEYIYGDRYEWMEQSKLSQQNLEEHNVAMQSLTGPRDSLLHLPLADPDSQNRSSIISISSSSTGSSDSNHSIDDVTFSDSD